MKEFETLKVTTNHSMTWSDTVCFALGLDSIEAESAEDQARLAELYGKEGYEYIYESDDRDENGDPLYAVDMDMVERGLSDDEEEERRPLESMPFDKAFENENGNEVLCHATGYEVFENGIWWNEYQMPNGELVLGN